MSFVSSELFQTPKKLKENDVDNNRTDNSRYGTAARNMFRGLLVMLIALAATGVASAQYNQEPSLKFKGGIGVNTVTGVAADGTIKLNVVRGVNPAGPWRIADLEASVRPDGHIRLEGRGLLLANGNGIGTNGGASVHATLFCGAADATATPFDSTAVALDADGDFRINGFLSGVPPTPCSNPVLLIRVGQPGGGAWFAAGIPDLEDRDHDKE